MKRYTLCKLCVLVLLILGMAVWLWYLPAASQEEQPAGVVLATGRVVRIEEKENTYHQKQTVVSLDSVTFCNKDFQIEENQIYLSPKGYAEGILCYLEQEEMQPFYGQKLIVSGKAEAFQNSRNPGGFDAALYYRTKGIRFYLQDTEIMYRGEEYDALRQKLYEIRTYLGERLVQISGADAGIMQSIFLGEKKLLLEETKDLYQSGGISHILAISGLHISFFGVGLYHLTKRGGAPIPIAAVISGSVLFLYAVMTGESPSACRAVMMFLLRLLADVLRRSYERKTALAVSAVIQVLQQPFLFCQSGFWLSYGAVFGLEVITPVLDNLRTGRIGKQFTGGISVSLITLPILLCSYYEFPVLSVFLNLFVIPMMGIVMLVGFLAFVAGSIFLPLGKLVFLPVHLILLFFQLCCEISEKIPGNIWVTGKPERWQIAMYIVVVLWFLFWGYKKSHALTEGYSMLLLCGALWILTGSFITGGKVTVLDVGQGDCIVLQDDRGNAVMIDGGSTSEKKLAEYTLIPYLKSGGITRLDYVFLTHMDTDHTSGVEELLEQMAEAGRDGKKGIVKIATLVLPDLSVPDEVYYEIVGKAREAGVRVCTMRRGETLDVGRMHFLCMHPMEQEVYGDRNAASLVLYLQMQTLSALFMGDIDGETEQKFATAYPQQLGAVEMLKVGHHGSQYSSSMMFLEQTKPEAAIISCGENNDTTTRLIQFNG